MVELGERKPKVLVVEDSIEVERKERESERKVVDDLVRERPVELSLSQLLVPGFAVIGPGAVEGIRGNCLFEHGHQGIGRNDGVEIDYGERAALAGYQARDGAALAAAGAGAIDEFAAFGQGHARCLHHRRQPRSRAGTPLAPATTATSSRPPIPPSEPPDLPVQGETRSRWQ